MTTVEKLVIQIFDRKKSIIEQAKRQAETYNHHVASKLLIDGITPPSWLFSPTTTSRELNKEDVISKLLYPYQRPSVCRSSAHYSLYSNQFGTGNVSEGTNGENRQAEQGISHEYELDVSITSPVDQTDERISSIYNATDQSLARIHRSKSRQKALELRSGGGKSLIKNGISHGNINDNFRLSIFSVEQDGGGKDGVVKGCKDRVFNDDSCGKDVLLSRGSVGIKRRGSDIDSSRSDCANKLRKSGPSAVCFQSSVLDEEECRGRDTENNVTRLDFSCKRAGASSEAQLSDNAQRNHNEIMDHLPADYALGPLERAIENVFDEGCNSHPSIAEDCQNEKGKETSVDPYYGMAGSSSSSPDNACADETPHQDIFSQCNEDDSRPFHLSNERLARQIDGPSEEPGLVEYSFGIIDEKRDTDMAVGSELVLRYQLDHSVSSSSVDTNRRIEPGLVECSFGIIDEKRNTDMAVGSELVLCDQLDHSISSSSVDPNRRIELEPVVAPSPTTSLVFSEPNELNIGMHKDNNLKIQTPISGYERLNDASEKTDCSFSDIAASVDNVILCNTDRLSIAEVSKHNSSDVHKKGGDGNCDYSEVQDGINIMHLEVEDTPELHRGPVKLHLDHSHDSLPVQHVDVGSSNACRESYSLDLIKKADLHDDLVMKGEAGTPAFDIHDRTNQIRTEDTQALPCQDVSGQHAELTQEESGFTNTTADGSPAFTSWPQLKRRKTDHQQETNRHTTSPCIRTKFLSTERCPSSTDLMNLKKDVDLADAFRVTEITQMESNQLNDSNLVEVECTFESQNGENQFYSKEQNEQQSSLTVNEQSEIILVASPPKKRARNSDEKCVEGMGTHSSLDHLDAIDDKQCSHHSISIDNITNEKLTFIITSELEDGLQSQCLVGSPRDNHQDFDAVYQSMPIYEGFVVDAQANSGDLECLEDEIDLDQLKLPSSMIERADVLAKICRSASTKTTQLSDSSSASEFQSNLFMSVPNGLFKSLNTSFLPVNGNVHENLRFGNRLVNNAKDSFERMPYYSDSLPYSGARFGWNSRYPHASPVGKFSERLSSHSSSSEKRLSVNPNLTCFRIEEDYCVGDENENMAGDKRLPLKETTNLVLIPPETKYKDKEGLETETSTLANTGVEDNQSFSFGAVRIKKSKESINNSVSKTVSRSKSSLNRPEQKLPRKESGRNNIVSHFSSFLPLVQPKKGAAPAGKREVKVKALETAEAAKRLEEERENERKKKKEAVKAERAKLEEKNLRQMELEKKRKEEERKKKDADILARKRLREEEEKKEREKKRVRLEARQRQREQEEERVRAKKYEKENDHPKIREKTNSKKELNESKKPQNKEMIRKDDVALKKTEVKRSLATSEIYNENCGISGQSSEAKKATHTVDNSPTGEMLIVQKSQENSYEISPYQCSDGEDEEEDELRTQKYVPSWASKSSVALVLPLQQGMDPDAIFFSKSCCSVDEVLFSCNVR